MKREELFDYVKERYGTRPEYLWKFDSQSAVLRHKNGKWYAVLMSIETSKLGLEDERTIDIINVKCEPDIAAVLTQTSGFFLGYHMNKRLMSIETSKLGLEDERTIDIINVKCEPDIAAVLTQTSGFFLGYHMNKRHWITILLDGTVTKEQILDFLDRSYELINKKGIV